MTFVPLDAQKVPTLPGAAYDNLEALLQVTGSVGVIDGGTITDAGAGQINISAVEFRIRTINDVLGPLVSATLAAQTNVALTDNAQNYIFVAYNGGTPQLNITTSIPADNLTNVILGMVYRTGTTLHITNFNVRLEEHEQEINRRLVFTQGITREGGGVTTESGTRNLQITEGYYWLGLDRYTLPAINTAVSDTFSYFYQNGVGGFTEVTAQTQINNTQYDDGSGSLATLANNQYGVHWIYKGLDNDTYVVYGRGSYTLTEAENAEEPGNLPAHFSIFHVKLIAKALILKSAASITEFQYPFSEKFAQGSVQSHSDLANLSNDDHTQYVLADGTRDVTGAIRFQNNVRVDGQAYQEAITTVNSGATTATIDWNNGNIQILDLGAATGDVTVSFSNAPAGGGTLFLKVIQGANLVDLILPATVKGPGGAAGAKTLDITATNDAIDVVILTKVGADYYYELKQNYA